MTDTVLRAMTDDGSFRVIVARTTSTVQGAVGAQSVTGLTAQTFGDLLSGSILVRETMAPQHRVQGILKREGQKGSLVADSHPDGTTRGLVSSAVQASSLLGAGSVLQMMRTMPNGALHQGIVEVPESGGISSALMAYMQSSEQVDSVIAVGTVVGEAGVAASGGYIVQLLPEASRDMLRVMTDRLALLDPIESLVTGERGEPKALCAELLSGMPFTLLEESPLRFECRCSHERVLASLATLRRSDLAEMLAEKRIFEINCDYCNAVYRVGPGDLRALLGQN